MMTLCATCGMQVSFAFWELAQKDTEYMGYIEQFHKRNHSTMAIHKEEK